MNSLSAAANVFADLGLPNPEELQMKADLAIEIRQAIQDKKLTRKRAAEKMGLSKPEVDQIFDGKYFDFTLNDLVHFLNCLDRDVTLSASVRERPHKAKGQTQEKKREIARA